MSDPKRIQRKRTKGWKMPDNTIYVGRPSRWGNPFAVGEYFVNRGPWADCPYRAAAPARERDAVTGWGRPYREIVTPVANRAHAVDLFRAHIAYEDIDWDPAMIRAELAGKDLACWCPLDQPCHADVLLEIANKASPSNR